MAKKNGRMIISIISLTIIVVGCVMAIAKTYFILPAEVAHQAITFSELKKDNSKDHDQFKADVKSCDKQMAETKVELVGIKKDIGYLGLKMDDNILEQKAFQVEQRTMQKTILTKIEELKK